MGTFTQASLDTAIAKARAEGFAAGKAEGKTEGMKASASAERVRISAILNSEEGKKRPAAALAAALDMDATAEATAKFLARLPEESTRRGKSRFELAMDRGSNPDLGAPGDGSESRSRASRAVDLAYGSRARPAA